MRLVWWKFSLCICLFIYIAEEFVSKIYSEGIKDYQYIFLVGIWHHSLLTLLLSNLLFQYFTCLLIERLNCSSPISKNFIVKKKYWVPCDILFPELKESLLFYQIRAIFNLLVLFSTVYLFKEDCAFPNWNQ